MNTMLAYRYDVETFEFIEPVPAQLDPLESKKMGLQIYILPANCTFAIPPKQEEGKAIVFSKEEDKWQLVEDHRGKEIWKLSDGYYGTPDKVKTIGAIPKGYSLERPPKTLNEVRKEKLEEMKFSFNNAFSSAHLVSSLGFEIDANETASRNIRGLIDFFQDDVEFCDYNNQMQEVSLEDLNTMIKEITLNGQYLYQQKWEYRDAINNAKTKEDIESIKIKFENKSFD